jgi:hypothetical protein
MRTLVHRPPEDPAVIHSWRSGDRSGTRRRDAGEMPIRKPYDADAASAFVRQRAGVCRASELERLGIPPSTTWHRCRPAGPWQRLLPGVVLTSNGVPTSEQLLIAGLVYAGSGAVLTGLTALRLYGVTAAQGRGDYVHALVPHGRRRVPVGFAVVERTRRLPEHRRRKGLPCAPVARAVIDAVRRIRDRDAVRAIVAEVVQRGLTTIADLAAELRSAQRRGTAVPRTVLREVAAGVRSAAEAQARETILSSGLPQPLWNAAVYSTTGQFLGRPDAFWPDHGVALEIDSLEWHLSPADYRRTQARQRGLAKAGVLVLPVTPSVVRDDPRGLIRDVAEALESGSGRPAPAVIVRRAA